MRILFLAAAVLLAGSHQNCLASVRTGIELTSVGSPFDLPPPTMPAVISPDGMRAALVTYAGDVGADSNHYRILVLDKRHDRFASARAVFALSTREDTTIPGLSGLHWLDNHTLFALVLGVAGHSRVVRIDIRTGKRQFLTEKQEDVIDYAPSGPRGPIGLMRAAGTADPAPAPSTYAGRLIGSEEPYALLGDRAATFSRSGFGSHNRIVLREGGHDIPVPIPDGEWAMPGLGFSVSPSGRYLIIPVGMARPQVPARWLPAGTPRNWVFLYGLRLYDRRQGRLRWLIDEPTFWSCSVPPRWSADESTVFISSRFIRKPDGGLSAGAALVSVSSGHILSSIDGAFHQIGGGTSLSDLHLFGTGVDKQAYDVVQTENSWSFEPVTPSGDVISLKQDMQHPPMLMQRDLSSGLEKRLLDLNPGLRMDSVDVQQFSWTMTDGTALRAGLYLPRGRKPGERLPLVIQTHGWDASQFWYDGPSTAGFAAASLAEEGFAVVQIGSLPPQIPLEHQVRSGVDMIDTLVDALDRAGMIDPQRLGITAWSATGLAVRAALAFGRHHFAAAVLVDARDDGFFNYLLTEPQLQDVSDAELGGMPFGAGLEVWRTTSPMFNMDRVTTPIRLVSLGPRLLAHWEQWASMKRLGKPIEFVWLPDTNHWPIRPSERMEVQQGAVDWYRFWLTKAAAEGPAEASEFTRWRLLRRQGSDQVGRAPEISDERAPRRVQ